MFAARQDGELVGVGALKILSPDHAELKSMHTSQASRGKGVGRSMVNYILEFARQNNISRISLETGNHPPYEPARKLYESMGFVPCEAFGDYELSEFNVCMTRLL